MATKKIIIVYCTRYGATKETAEDLRSILETQNCRIDLVNLKDIPTKKWPSLQGYDGIIVGSSIAMGKWMKEPLKYLKSVSSQINNHHIVFGAFVSCATCINDIDRANAEYIDEIFETMEVKPSVATSFGPIFDLRENGKISVMKRMVIKGVAQMIEKDNEIQIDDLKKNDFRSKENIEKFVEDFLGLF